jgi:hypothetical protein
MAKYQVLVTGTAYVVVDADNPVQAELEAVREVNRTRFGVWDMDLQFVCEEQDLLEGEDDGV